MAIKLQSYPKFKYTLADGTPAVGYQLFTYEAGTTTKKLSYTDFNKVGENTNPIILNAAGECELWLDGNYKLLLTDPDDTDPPTGTPEWTIDNVTTEETSVSTVGNYNIILNGSFETDTDGDGVPDSWTLVALTGGSIAITDSSQYHGRYSLAFTSTTAGGGTATSESYFEVRGDSYYTCAFNIISTSATTHNTVEVYWYDVDKVYISKSTVYDKTTGNPTSWANYNQIVTAPSTARYAKLVVTGVAADSTTLAATSRFDGIILSEYVLNHEIPASTSGTDTYTVSIGLPALNTGEVYKINFSNANTSTTPTLNIDSLGAKTIKLQSGRAVRVGDLNGIHELEYDGTDLLLRNPVVLNNIYNQTPVDTSAGTQTSYTLSNSIPSGVKRIRVNFSGTSLDATAVLVIRLGTGGSPTTSGYTGYTTLSTTSTGGLNHSSGYDVSISSAASNVYYGNVVFELTNSSSNTWAASASIASTTGAAFLSGGEVSLSGALDTVVITTIAGTANFDAGSASLSWEY